MSIKGINTYLISKKHKNIALVKRRRIIADLGQIPNIIQDEAGLREFQFPLPTTKAISVL
jgi:hypothetical protein